MVYYYYLSVFLKGLAMGACDVVPGVSGGTVAFVTGIYEKLISSLTLLKPSLFIDLKKNGFSYVWNKVDGNFLACLGFGIATGLLTFAKLMTYLLEKHPPVIWSLFFSLVLASSLTMLLKVTKWNFKKILFFMLGLSGGYLVTILSPSTGSNSYAFVFSSGFIAICAMILPGISGSFILLLLGQYVFILNALVHMNLPVIFTFAIGCFFGLLLFSHILKWLFAHYHQTALCLLTGVMFGSLNKLWPWKETISFFVNRHGKKVPAVEKNILPSSYEALSLDPMLTVSIIIMILAFLGVFLFDRISKKSVR